MKKSIPLVVLAIILIIIVASLPMYFYSNRKIESREINVNQIVNELTFLDGQEVEIEGLTFILPNELQHVGYEHSNIILTNKQKDYYIVKDPIIIEQYLESDGATNLAYDNFLAAFEGTNPRFKLIYENQIDNLDMFVVYDNDEKKEKLFVFSGAIYIVTNTTYTSIEHDLNYAKTIFQNMKYETMDTEYEITILPGDEHNHEH